MPRNCVAYVKRLRGICQPITRHMSSDENDAVLARSLLGSSAEIALAHISCGFEVVRDTDEVAMTKLRLYNVKTEKYLCKSYYFFL